jgi:photosystem II stability/assembly factor-like uncharacterized protein
MNAPDLETRIRSYYEKFAPDDSTRLTLASAKLLEDVRRPQPRRFVWTGLRLAATVTAAAVLLAVLVLSRLAPEVGPEPGTASPGPTFDPTAALNAQVDEAGLMRSGGIWAVRGSYLLTSADNGANWRAGSFPASAPSPFVLDSEHAWAIDPGVSAGGVALDVVRTSDGGRTWAQAPTAGNFTCDTPTVSFVDATHGFVMCSVPSTNRNGASTSEAKKGSGTVLRSDDGGATWSVTGSATGLGSQFTASDASTLWAAPDFASSQMTGVQLSVSRDAGRTWSTVDLPELASVPAQTKVGVTAGPVFWDASDGAFAVGVFQNGSGTPPAIWFYRTQDSGRSWTLVKKSTDFPMMDFPPSATVGRGWAARILGNYNLTVSDDFGASWTDVSGSGMPQNSSFLSVDLTDKNHGLATVLAGPGRYALMLSSDSGRSWHPADFGDALTKVPTTPAQDAAAAKNLADDFAVMSYKDPPTAWAMLSPYSQQVFGSESEFAAAEAALNELGNYQYQVSEPTKVTDFGGLGQTLRDDLTKSADMSRAYLVAVSYPGIPEPVVPSEALITAPLSTTGEWRVWAPTP